MAGLKSTKLWAGISASASASALASASASASVVALVLGASLIFSSGAASAMPSSEPFQVGNKKLNRYIQHGTMMGGEAAKEGEGFSLLNVRREVGPKSLIERVVLDLGDAEGKAALERVGFFTINLERAPMRLVVDLSQVQSAGVSGEQMRLLFAKSPYVARADLSFDPEDLSTSLILDLKRPVEVEAFKMLSKEKPGRIVMDLKPLGNVSAKPNVKAKP